MYLYIKKAGHTALLYFLGICGILSAQSTAFSYQYWDSLYSTAIEQHPDSVNAVIQQLLYTVEITNDIHSESYSKYILAHEFLRIGEDTMALEYNNQALLICQNSHGKAIDHTCKKILGSIFYLHAKIHQITGNLNQAIFYYQRIKELVGDTISKESLLTEIGLGEIYLSKGEYLKAYNHFEVARQLVIDHKLGNKMAAMVLEESAELMSVVGLDSLSEKNLLSAEQIALEYADTLLLIKILFVRGNNHLQRKQHEKAEIFYTEALNLSKQKHADNLNALAQLGLGKIAFESGNLTSSLSRFKEAVRLTKFLFEKKTLAESQAYIGKIHLQQGLLDSALIRCNKAYDISSQTNLLRIQLLSCNCLKQIYEQKQDWQSAFDLQEEENNLKENLNENLVLHKISSVRFEQEMTHLKEQQTRERERLESDQSWTEQLVSLQSSRIFLLSILFGISLLLIFFLFRIFRTKNSHNKELQLLNLRLHNGNQLLEQSNTNLNQSNETLQQTNQALNNFAAVAAHDLKGPLRTINSFTQLLQRKLGDKVEKNEEEYFQYINGSSKKLSTLIDDLLNFSRLGKKMTAPSEINLNNILKDVKANLNHAINDTHAIIVQEKLPAILANSSLMTQLFQNIISNSLKFAQAKCYPEIKIISKTLENNRIQISIQDNGIGIPTDQQEQVFELFTRLNSKEKYEGSGVGLATCRKIVQHYGGKMKIDSTEGIGTSVVFDLPLS